MGTEYRPEKNFWVPGTSEERYFGYRWVPARKNFLGTGSSEKKHFGYRWIRVPARKFFEYQWVPGTGQKKFWVPIAEFRPNFQ